MRGEWALFVLRVSLGLMMLLGHGLPKLLSFNEKRLSFPDPLGLGSTVSLSLTVFAEVFCALAVVAGFKIRWSVLPLMITMAVAALVIHANDPWPKKELAVLYLLAFSFFFFFGSGKFSTRYGR